MVTAPVCPSAPLEGRPIVGRAIHVRGTVQGVGFRPWIYRIAHAAGIAGRVWNDATGVAIRAFGDEQAMARFADLLGTPPSAASVVSMDWADIAVDVDACEGFAIVDSTAEGGARVSIPPDLATCPDCLREVFDRHDRRYRYAFTNCTNCGPRFTIATDIPYDRRSTTMAPFGMCEACRREFDDPANRRFHAQPNACPVCGPRLQLLTGDGDVIHADDPIVLAALALRDGVIVAVKGLGGFHLACDATNENAVRRLRARKHRDQKPLAVMVRHLEDARRVIRVGEVECALLTSPERPIVVAAKHDSIGMAPSIAPDNRTLGVMLPYSALHHLLLAEAGRPLVMTSGNLSDEPIASGNEEALRRLGGIADLLVTHDRDIALRCDDSVVTVINDRGTLLRRSRGYVPRPVRLATKVARPTLGCGALLKNTFCIASGDSAWFGPHIGDLEHVETYDAYRQAIAALQRFLQIEPQVVAHDLHPDYQSTRYALSLPNLTTIGVQHHHAHVVSAMTEHGIGDAAIGIAYDGTGYGTDGTSWGGEVLCATVAGFERVATFRPLRLAGGDRAIREPWRIALALVMDAFNGECPPRARELFGYVPDLRFEGVRRLLLSSDRPPLARGVGRYFDAFGALFMQMPDAHFEGQVALAWNQIALPKVTRVYRFGITPGAGCPEVDLRMTTKDALTDLLAGEPAGAIAAAFHNTIAEATACVVRRALKQYGRLPVVASGGCFQNVRLAESVSAALQPECRVLLHEQVPPGDGGVALGQAVIASALCA